MFCCLPHPAYIFLQKSVLIIWKCVRFDTHSHIASSCVNILKINDTCKGQKLFFRRVSALFASVWYVTARAVRTFFRYRILTYNYRYMNLFALDICWIYITRDALRSGKRHIRCCTDEDWESARSRYMAQGEQLLYRRRFDNTFDALAHKLMLEHLSAETLDFLIQRYGENGGR